MLRGRGGNRQGKSRRGGEAEDEGSGGVHCGFIPANTFIMADLAEPVTHCRGYISASIPTTTTTTSIPPPPPPVAPHPNFDPILAGISRILTKPLFFNDFPTLFLDTTATSQAKGEQRSFTSIPFRAARYGRVTYAHTIFFLRRIVVKRLPNISPTQRIARRYNGLMRPVHPRFGND